MTFTAEVRLEHPSLLLARTMDSLADVRVEREYQMAGDTGERYAFVSVYTTVFDAFEGRLAADPTVAESSLVASFDDRRLYRLTLTDEVVMIDRRLASLGIAVAEASGVDGRWRLVLRVPERDRLAAFNDYCEERSVNLSVERLSRLDDDDDGSTWSRPLTDAQREALVTAYRNGYFDEPRRTSLKELATDLNVSATAVGGRIQRGTAKLVDAVLLADEHNDAE
jgi:predicted DNA binding protein